MRHSGRAIKSGGYVYTLLLAPIGQGNPILSILLALLKKTLDFILILIIFVSS
jgi:hypothetical protein